jgi:two-component SAPR family response regulator
MYTCGIVEDEYLARKLLIKYINKFEKLNILWHSETIPNLHALPNVDLVFLDLLDVPLNSFELSEGINEFALHCQNIIITTAYAEDYVRRTGLPYSYILTKPYTYSTFATTVTAVLSQQ